MNRKELLFKGYRVVFYARVSTEEEEQLNAIELQIEENRSVIAENGGTLVDEYIDRGKSGTMTKKRDDYLRLYEDMSTDKFDIICIKDQDRLMRNTRDWYLFVDRLVTTGKKLYLYLDGKFFIPAEDALITGVKAIMAEEYSRNLSKKLTNYNKRRLDKARAGETVRLQGSGNAYGWNKKDGVYTINPEQFKIRRLMCELTLQGMGTTAVAEYLNSNGYRNSIGKEWRAQDIPKFIYDEKNIGTLIINKERRDFDTKTRVKVPPEEWVTIENALPPVVTPEEWERLCKIREERTTLTRGKYVGKKKGGYFTGKLVCGCCGAPYWRSLCKNRSKEGSREYWVCKTKQTEGRKTRMKTTAKGKAGDINPKGCDNANISYNDLMEILQRVADQLSANTDQIKADMLSWLENLKANIVKSVASYTEEDLRKEESRRDKLLDSYLDGIISKEVYRRKNQDLEARIKMIQKDIESCHAQAEDIEDIDNIIKNIDKEVEKYIAENENLKLNFVLENLKSIVVYDDFVEVNIPVIGSGVMLRNIQLVSRQERCREKYNHFHSLRIAEKRQRNGSGKRNRN